MESVKQNQSAETNNYLTSDKTLFNSCDLNKWETMFPLENLKR